MWSMNIKKDIDVKLCRLFLKFMTEKLIEFLFEIELVIVSLN